MEDLPDPVMVDILSRVHVKTIIHCKCVCKKWRDLVSDSYFANLHLSRSPSGFMIHHNSEKERNGDHNPGVLKWVEVEDELDHHHLHRDPLMSLDLNLAHGFQDYNLRLVGSVNGLICIRKFCSRFDEYFLCNPITREYIILPKRKHYKAGYALVNHGFGFGLLTQEYKVIRISREYVPWTPTSTSRVSLLKAKVYTLGTGQWRSLGRVPYKFTGSDGPFLNSHAHWIVDDEDSPENICVFDFDNEMFKLFPSPPVENIGDSKIYYKTLAVLNGCLCQCDSYDSHFTIWVMKEYGIKTSWHKELVMIMKESIFNSDQDRLMWAPLYLIEGLRDGTILMVCSEEKLLAYSSKRGTIAEYTGYFDPCFTGIAYRPSFLKLRNFASERVKHLF